MRVGCSGRVVGSTQTIQKRRHGKSEPRRRVPQTPISSGLNSGLTHALLLELHIPKDLLATFYDVVGSVKRHLDFASFESPFFTSPDRTFFQHQIHIVHAKRNIRTLQHRV